MANNLYAHGRQAFATAQVNWPSDTINVTLVDYEGGAGYTPDLANDQFITAIPSGARAATVALANKTAPLGVLTADNATFPAVPAGGDCEAVVIWKDTGTEGTSPLLLLIDTATGLDVIPNGGDITCEWSEQGIATL